MRRAMRFTVLLLGSIRAVATVAGELDGRYVADQDPGTTMTLVEAADGSITGTITDATATMPLSAVRSTEGFAGTLGPDGYRLPLAALVEGGQIVVAIGSDVDRVVLSFRSTGAASAGTRPSPAAGSSRHVVINGHRFDAAELETLEGRYRGRLPDGDYWYDPVLGAWGFVGGPTQGFVVPGLSLGGPLQPGASGGGTRVFVNGRELHPYDVLALQQITGPVPPGRYFITSQGLAGPEGGPPLWNLVAMAAQVQGVGSTTWQGRMSSGFSDGTTGAVFLPNGGIVSTGQ